MVANNTYFADISSNKVVRKVVIVQELAGDFAKGN
jgi:hypothetical protein